MARRPNPVDGFAVDRDQLSYIGNDLQRPECILAERDGTLWSADARGGVMRIRPDGSQTIVTQTLDQSFSHTADEVVRFTQGTLPNGLAFAANGEILIANFGTDRLEVMSRTGETRVLLDEIEGQPIGKVNFVLRDSRERLWLTVSTRVKNWMEAVQGPDLCDGYIALLDERGVRIVADGFHSTNEIRFDANEEHLYVVESTAQCVSRLRVGADGSLSGREVYGPSRIAPVGFVDGIAFDVAGNLWGTVNMSDKIFAITPEGDLRLLLVDDNPAPSLVWEKAFNERRLTPEIMLACGGTIAPWFASVTFGGPDLRTVYIGSLRGTRIPYFRSPVAGLPMIHW
jgi:sugar lactone lactonase YvrE